MTLNVRQLTSFGAAAHSLNRHPTNELCFDPALGLYRPGAGFVVLRSGVGMRA